MEDHQNCPDVGNVHARSSVSMLHKTTLPHCPVARSTHLAPDWLLFCFVVFVDVVVVVLSLGSYHYPEPPSPQSPQRDPLGHWTNGTAARGHMTRIWRLFSNRGQRNRQTGRLHIFKRPGGGQNFFYAQLWLDLTKLCLPKALAPNCSTWRRSIVPSSPVFFFSSPPSVLLFFLFSQIVFR